MRTTSKLILSMFLLSLVALTLAKGGVTSPPIFKAGEVAYLDYSQKLATDRAGDSKLAKHLREIGNYEVRMSETAGSFTVAFIPKSPPGAMLAGGGAEYRISASFEIVSMHRYK